MDAEQDTTFLTLPTASPVFPNELRFRGKTRHHMNVHVYSRHDWLSEAGQQILTCLLCAAKTEELCSVVDPGATVDKLLH